MHLLPQEILIVVREPTIAARVVPALIEVLPSTVRRVRVIPPRADAAPVEPLGAVGGRSGPLADDGPDVAGRVARELGLLGAGELWIG